MDARVQSLFAELAALPESVRLARLGEVADGLPEEVRLEVESLLRFDAATGASTSLFQGPMVAVAQSFLEGPSCLGNYRILRLLGEGGMGRVYEAEQLDSGRRVALKVLHSVAPTAEERERFLREGRLAAAVRHPNSVFVYGSEEAAGGSTLFIVMELVAGGTLKERLQKSGPFDFQEAARITIQLLNGLEAAHGAGVLHRDIKPSNCFLDDNGQVKLGDYGISRRPVRHSQETATFTIGSFAGTPGYASPEQLQGDEQGPATDIYSVGANLYHLLTGRPPFEQKDMVRLIAAVMSKAPPSPSEIRPEVPLELSRIVMKCLEKDPLQRYPSVAALRTALEPFDRSAFEPAPLELLVAAKAVEWLPVLLAAEWVLQAAAGAAGSSARLWVPAAVAAIAVVVALVEDRFAGATWGGKRLFGIRLSALALAERQRLQRSGTSQEQRRHYARLVAISVLPSALAADLSYHLRTIFPFAIAFAATALLQRNIVRMKRNGVASARLASSTSVAAADGNKSTMTTTAHKIGPYVILDRIETAPGAGQSDGGGSAGGAVLYKGWDPILRRHVWVVDQPPGTPPVAPGRRDEARAGRPRWLAGRRVAPGTGGDGIREYWDAFEYPEGRPLVEVEGKVDWPTARGWLLDVAEEAAADPSIVAAGSGASALSLERIWIDRNGRAVILDYPASRPTANYDRVEDLLRAVALRLGVSPERGAPYRVLELLLLSPPPPPGHRGPGSSAGSLPEGSPPAGADGNEASTTFGKWCLATSLPLGSRVPLRIRCLIPSLVAVLVCWAHFLLPMNFVAGVSGEPLEFSWLLEHVERLQKSGAAAEAAEWSTYIRHRYKRPLADSASLDQRYSWLAALRVEDAASKAKRDGTPLMSTAEADRYWYTMQHGMGNITGLQILCVPIVAVLLAGAYFRRDLIVQTVTVGREGRLTGRAAAFGMAILTCLPIVVIGFAMRLGLPDWMPIGAALVCLGSALWRLAVTPDRGPLDWVFGTYNVDR